MIPVKIKTFQIEGVVNSSLNISLGCHFARIHIKSDNIRLVHGTVNFGKKDRRNSYSASPQMTYYPTTSVSENQ